MRRETARVRVQVGERLRAFREGLGLSQPAMARLVDCGPSTLKTFEVGKSFPGAEILRGYGKAGADLNWILDGFAEDEGQKLTPHDFRLIENASETPGDPFVVLRRSWMQQELRCGEAEVSVHVAHCDSLFPTVRCGDAVLVVHGQTPWTTGDGVYLLRIDGAQVFRQCLLTPHGAATCSTEGETPHVFSVPKDADLWVGRVAAILRRM